MNEWGCVYRLTTLSKCKQEWLHVVHRSLLYFVNVSVGACRVLLFQVNINVGACRILLYYVIESMSACRVLLY